MTTKNDLINTVNWPVFFLCIFSIAGASVSLGYRPADATHSRHRGIIDRGMTDFSRDFLSSHSVTLPERTEPLTAAVLTQSAPPNLGGKVTASWYGSQHQNKRTANGQKFHMQENTLAHRTLPLGTKVRLINPHNGKSAEGVVNDRGPYVKGRDVDVSYAMAKQLGFARKGVMKLDMEGI
jgi:rare lipoprotein A